MKYVKLWTRHYSILHVECCLRSISEYAKNNNFDYLKNVFFLVNDGSSSLYCSKIEFDKFQKKILKKYTSSYKKIKEFEKNFIFFTNKELSKYPIKNLKNLSDIELKNIIKNYYGFWQKFTLYVFKIWLLSEEYSKFAFNKLKNEVSNEILDYMSKPNKKSSILLLNQEISKMMSLGKIDKNKILKKFVWITFGDFHAKPLSINDIDQLIKKHIIVKENYVNISKLKKEHKTIVMINKEIAYLRDYRDELRRKIFYEMHFVFKELSKRKRISYNDLIYYTMPEIINGIKLNKKDIEIRKEKSILFLNNKILFGDDVKNFIKSIEIDKSFNKNIKQVSGIVACKGKITGNVKLVILNKHLSKIKINDIMVAVTTHPEYVTKMKKASAIITDEGGLTSHAAIVSRELNIPCIVGTKHATKVFKDNDLVEVDADKGVVRKIK